MARTSTTRRRERETDPMDSLKPLIVLGLLGMIMYGAYSVVQRGPGAPPPGVATTDGGTATGVFAPPDVSLPPAPTAIGGTAAHPLAGAEPLQTSPTYLTAAPAADQAPIPAAGALGLPPPAPLAGDASLTASAATGDMFTPAVAPAPFAPPAAGVAVPAVAAPAMIAAADASAATQSLLPPAPPSALAAPPQARSAPSAAFTSAWAEAHEKLSAGRYAEALAVLSVWYDDPSLGLEESQRLEDLLGQLAGTVIYSQKDLLLPPHIVAAGDTLQSIATPLQVPWQLVGKINGVNDPSQLVQGEHLKVVRGPFDAVISVSRRRMSLQVGGNYAGSFPVVLGQQVYQRVGQSVAVLDIRRPGASVEAGSIASQVAYAPSAGPKSIVLGDGLSIEGVEDPSLVADSASATSVIVSLRDLDDIADILGAGSQVMVRQ